MLDKVHNSGADLVNQTSSLDRIKEIELKSGYRTENSDYFIDESDISTEAYKKYEREMDVSRFSKILMETDEKEANELVMQKLFDGTISFTSTDIIGELTDNSNFIDDVIRQN